MKKLSDFLKLFLLVALSFIGCTGKTAIISPELLPSPNYSFRSPSSVSCCVGQGGQSYFQGGPSEYGGMALKASIDLKQIQEVAAKKVLSCLFTKTDNYPQDINITSTINNFSYRFPWRFAVKTRLMVSFEINITATDKKNNLISTNTITVKDYLGTTEKFIGLSGGLWILMQSDANKVSQLVGDTVLEKVYEIFVFEFEKISKIQVKKD